MVYEHLPSKSNVNNTAVKASAILILTGLTYSHHTPPCA